MTQDEISAVIERVIGFNSCCGWEHKLAREIAAVEREACAKVCLETGIKHPQQTGQEACAAAIRARGMK